MNIIFTNGCFDILHYGHVKLLDYCHSLAYKAPGGPGKVVVGLNSDNSITKLKGPTRPINSELDRAFLLESLKYVDQVEIFDEDTPYELIKRIRPSIIVKGGDYDGSITDKRSPRYVVGSDLAEVKIFNIIEGVSTTLIEQKLNDENVL